MKRLTRVLPLLVAITIALARTSVAGDDTTKPEKPTTTKTDRTDAKPDKPAKPERPAKPELPTEIKSALENFEKVRDAYLAEQKALLAQLKDASKDERTKIREKLQQTKEEFASKREEFKDALKQLHKDTPRPDVKDDKNTRPGGKGRP